LGREKVIEDKCAPPAVPEPRIYVLASREVCRLHNPARLAETAHHGGVEKSRAGLLDLFFLGDIPSLQSNYTRCRGQRNIPRLWVLSRAAGESIRRVGLGHEVTLVRHVLHVPHLLQGTPPTATGYIPNLAPGEGDY